MDAAQLDFASAILRDPACTVQVSLDHKSVDKKGKLIEGFYTYDDGTVRTSCAPGMVVFWPLEPLKGETHFAWVWGDGGRSQSARGTFQAK